MALVGKIRRMYLRDNMSFSEIARRTSLSRNTVKKWLKVPEAAPPKYRGCARGLPCATSTCCADWPRTHPHARQALPSPRGRRPDTPRV